jgi:hypothetical protein
VGGDRTDPLPDDVQRLLEDRLVGLEDLELLLLFCRESERSWTADAAGPLLGIPAGSLAPAFERLHAHQLIMPVAKGSAGYRFQPSTPALRATCERLRDLYTEDRFRIVGLMSQLAFERIRRSAARAFADAFRVRKKEDPDA